MVQKTFNKQIIYIYYMLGSAMDHIADFSMIARGGIWQMVDSSLSVAS
jgi:hypothetical protein